jgi:glucose-6-phosphate 1-epimerase
MILPVEVLGQPAMRLRAPDGAQAVVMLHGAHVVSWVPAGGVERLYTSPTALAGPGRSVRGGVPVCWPQFNLRGDLPGVKHGFARDRAWQWDAEQSAVRGGAAIGVLRLRDDEATRALWPHAFELELTVVVGANQLDIELAVTNPGEARFHFTGALHSYLRVDELRHAHLAGLRGTAYLDTVHHQEQVQEMEPLGFADEIDRIYWNAPEELVLNSGLGPLGIQNEGFSDAVVWNPGAAKAAALSDLPAEDWSQFLCVEAAAIAQPVQVAPGDTWVGRQGLIA